MVGTKRINFGGIGLVKYFILHFFQYFKVTVNQYDNPIDCYSEETIEDMTNSSGTWKKTDDQV